MIKTILWDVDGTLLSFKAAQRAALRKSFAHFGLGDCDEDMTERYSRLNERYWEMLEQGKITRPELYVGRFREFFADEGIDFEPAVFNACYHEHLGETIEPIDDGVNLVARLRGQVYQYIVTNGTLSVQRQKLSLSGLDRLVDGVFVSETLGAEKPSPVFFNKVFAEIAPAEKNEILIVGDSLSGDMQGGADAGIRCCWYNPGHKANTRNLPIEFEITDLHEVPEILKNENKNQPFTVA